MLFICQMSKTTTQSLYLTSIYSRTCFNFFHFRLLALYSGYNDWKKHKKRAPQLTVHDLKQHSSSLFSILMLPFSSSWGEFATDLKNLALCFDEYAAFLEKSNNEQQKRQQMNHPVREVATHAYLQHRSAVKDVKDKYSLLDTTVSKLDFYESLFFDEERHVNATFKNTFERFDFVENIALSEPIDILVTIQVGQLEQLSLFGGYPRIVA